MTRLDAWLRERSLACTLVLALGFVFLLGWEGVLSEDAMPFGDGEQYLMRAFGLYGYLHAGQWAQFWDLFTVPRQSLLPPHYLLFFLLPSSLAGVVSYSLVQACSSYGLLALGLWSLCRELDRPAWAPALFVLCAVQNISLDLSYFHFVDIPFFALATVALAWQVRAWKRLSWRASLLSGLGPGLLFWVKPANAVLFVGVYLMAEVIRLLMLWRQSPPGWMKASVRHLAAAATALIPVTFLALVCGGLQSIARLIDANEASGIFVTHLECGALVRLFYFPLCLTFFYHAGLVLLLAGGVAVMSALDRNENRFKPVPFPAALFWPVFLAAFLFGEFFSFGMANKEMRSLLVVLPLGWLGIMWATEKWRVRPTWLLQGALLYAACGFAQISSNIFATTATSTQSYQLRQDWLERMPPPEAPSPFMIEITRTIVSSVVKALPAGGKIAVGSEKIYITSESLTWSLQHNPALQARSEPYEFRNFIAADGRVHHAALLGSRALFLCSNPGLQYSEQVPATSQAIYNFAVKSWGDGYAQFVTVPSEGTGSPLGVLIVFREPLDDAHLTALVTGAPLTELPSKNEFTLFNDRRLSWSECWDILTRWKQKRLGN